MSTIFGSRWLPVFTGLLFGLAFLLSWSNQNQDTLTASRSLFEARSTTVEQLSGQGLFNVSLGRRDDSNCTSSKPCVNGACCGASGYCGYGTYWRSTYCGTGCQSNCDAVAECGQFAVPAGKRCPLNTCCSQFGFCGTTNDFCTNSCQSNCVQNPEPVGAVGPGVLDKVIGYYEAWSARSKCRPVQVTDLPLNALTHINFAFAYIDPTSFEIVTMDALTPESLFSDVVAVKRVQPNLQVYISVGGWSFSDNGTATQPVFGNIAASSDNRKRFSSNVLGFLDRYGFHGIDIDWEYPGAPDRGGRPEDTNNFVLMLEDLRNTLSASSRKLGITFTAPSSFWYLRWFDLPGLMKYADWVNVMTYDLHGEWDSSNPIGNVVQGHTNLTEIKLAMEFFWRVQIPPAKIAMGFGFYGRSFQLLNPTTCTTPGCRFKGGGNPGPCTSQSGILSYYEIQALLKSFPDLTPVYDTVAAVKYLVYSTDQWISYDDADTLKQKVEWGNSIGLSGSLIWASDLDDDQYTAHAGLIGEPVGSDKLLHANLDKSAFRPYRDTVSDYLTGQSGNNCYRSEQCVARVAIAEETVRSCPEPQKLIAWERGDCPTGSAHPVCCRASRAPQDCRWRGEPPMCSFENICSSGEISILDSMVGGSLAPLRPNNVCALGTQSLCCWAPEYKDIYRECKWTDCQLSNICPDGRTSLAMDSPTIPGEVWTTGSSMCPPYRGSGRPQAKHYCCKEPSRLGVCTWRGSPSIFRGSPPPCTNNKCKSNEVLISSSLQGDSDRLCSYGRFRSLCCTIEQGPTTKVTCPKSACDFDDACALGQDDEIGVAKRGVDAIFSQTSRSDQLAKRGRGRLFKSTFASIDILWRLRQYPSRGQLFTSEERRRDIPHRILRLRSPECDDITVTEEEIDPDNPPTSGETEHPLDGQILIPFGETLLNGNLPGDTQPPQRTSIGPIARAYLAGAFQANSLPNTLPVIGRGSNAISPTSPAERIAEALGSTGHTTPFLLVDRGINRAKGSLFGLTNPASESRRREIIRNAVRDQTEDSVNEMFATIRATFGVFGYAGTTLGNDRMRYVRDTIREQALIIGAVNQPGVGPDDLAIVWSEFLPAYLRQIEIVGQNFVRDFLDQIDEGWRQQTGPLADSVRQTTRNMRNSMGQLRFPRNL